MKEDSPLCLTRAIPRTMIGPCPRSAWLQGMLPEDEVNDTRLGAGSGVVLRMILEQIYNVPGEPDPG